MNRNIRIRPLQFIVTTFAVIMVLGTFSSGDSAISANLPETDSVELLETEKVQETRKTVDCVFETYSDVTVGTSRNDPTPITVTAEKQQEAEPQCLDQCARYAALYFQTGNLLAVTIEDCRAGHVSGNQYQCKGVFHNKFIKTVPLSTDVSREETCTSLFHSSEFNTPAPFPYKNTCVPR